MYVLIIAWTAVIVWIFSPGIWKHIPFGKKVFDLLASPQYWLKNLESAISQRETNSIKKIAVELKSIPDMIDKIDEIQSIFALEGKYNLDSTDNEIGEEILNMGFNINGTNGPCPAKWTALHYAAANANKVLTSFLLEKGADATIKDRETPQDYTDIKLQEGGRSPFLIACALGDTETLQTLIKLGKVDVQETDDCKRNCLHHACAQNSPEAASFLIENGGDISAVDKQGRNIMHYAAEFGGGDMVEFLLSLKFPVGDLDNEGESPLIRAVMANDLEAVKLLVLKGADVNLIVKGTGMTPLALAQNFEIAAELEAHGADLFQEIQNEGGEMITVADILKERLTEEELKRLDSYE
eukprot:TRINITY_DN3755_c0_g1_i7.p2 TRINITY_DN3755_c0_g1~~TRINITY_DN3755_c0_g1_i7.p2  ORF type:complete len:354 (-),score=57.72 TRINITY_DN3755_c0_g1_i7:151-1212(-)